jgi:hypothetical protein
MATASTKPQNTTVYPDLESAGERVREVNERILQAGRKVSTAYLDGLEQYVNGLVQFERKLGEQSHLQPVAGVLTAHAKLTEDITIASVSAARELIAS